MPTIHDFRFDDLNEDKLAAHGLTARRVAQVLDNDHRIVFNRKNRRAPYLIIGRDHGGQCIAIPVEPTTDAAVWRPVTAWFCKPAEWAWLP